MHETAGTPVWRPAFVVSGRTARRIARAPDGPLEASLDLGRTRSTVRIEADSATLPDGRTVDRAALAEAVSDGEDCIELTPAAPRKVYAYSRERCCYYKLFQPFEDRPPTIVINGATMHAIVGKDPWQDAAAKVGQVVAPRRGGRCLDTCCGLGYTAQLLVQTGFRPVVSCEVDPNVLAVAAVNPWSEGLWSEGIEVAPRDLRDIVADAPDARFACIFHDPPTVHQAGDLYAEELYRAFARVLAPGGVLYHYVGEPGRRVGRDYARGVIRRLQAAGFADVRRAVAGVLARKTR